MYENGEIPERQYRDAEHDVQEDQVAIARVRRTLQTWRVPEEEIAAVEAEAERLLAGKEKRPEELTQQWARVEVRAALDGVVLERNVAVGDMISTDEDLFKVADLAASRVGIRLRGGPAEARCARPGAAEMDDLAARRSNPAATRKERLIGSEILSIRRNTRRW